MCRDGRLGSALLWRNRDWKWEEPIDKHGWVLQESILSPRVLEFGKHQVRWRCYNQRQHYGPTDGWIPGRTAPYIDWAAVTEDPARLDFMGGFITKWRYLVEDYSRRVLTNPEDKLLAISAIVKKLHQLSGNEYVAGL